MTLGCGSVGDGVGWELREGAGEYDMTVSIIRGQGRVKPFSRREIQSAFLSWFAQSGFAFHTDTKYDPRIWE